MSAGLRLKPFHDRLLLADNGFGWTISQSLKDRAGRPPTLVHRPDDDLAGDKALAQRHG